MAEKLTVEEEKEIKPGWKTTEFWLALITPIVSILVTLGVIGQEQAEQLIKGSNLIVQGIFTAAPAVAYVLGRAWVKANAAKG